MIKIHKILIRNYKNLQVDDLKLSSFNLIVGPNNSGKSNFMQIFFFINSIINGSADNNEISFKKGRFDIIGSIVPDYFEKVRDSKKRMIFKIEFEDTISEFIYSYSIEIGWNYTKHEIPKIITLSLFIADESFDFKNKHSRGPSKNILKRTDTNLIMGDLLTKGYMTVIPNYLSGISLLKIVLNNEPNDHPYTIAFKNLESILKTETYYFSHTDLIFNEQSNRSTMVEGKTVSLNLTEEIIKLKSDEKLWKIFKLTLNQILKIDNVDTHSFDIPKSGKKEAPQETEKFNVIIYHHFKSLKLLNEFSDGTRLLIALIVKILSTKNELILIEEPENSLHPMALKNLVHFFRSFENEKQFIINSHSIILVNMIEPENVITSLCNNDGSSTLSKVSNMTELRKRLRNGHIVFSDVVFFGNEQDEEEI
jgi:AAA15 family ATPase/GTPase